MSDLSTTIVQGYRYTGDDLDLSGTDFWGFALDQRAFGPRQLVVVTARPDGAVLGLAHCQQTERPELALTCCLPPSTTGPPPPSPTATNRCQQFPRSASATVWTRRVTPLDSSASTLWIGSCATTSRCEACASR